MKRWNFTDKTKELAFARDKRSGKLPPETAWEDVDFHHKIMATDHSQPRSIVSSPANCQPLIRETHQKLNHKNLPDPDIPLQPPLFKD